MVSITTTSYEDSDVLNPPIHQKSTSECPRLRDDLVIRKATVQGEVFYRVKVPDSGYFFQIQETEYLILSLMNGERSTHEISEIAAHDHDLLIDAKVVDRFVRSLRKVDCLQNNTDSQTKSQRGEGFGKILRNILYLHLHLFNPDKFLTRHLTTVKPFFSWQFVTLAAVSGLLGLFLLIANRHQFVADFMNLGIVTGFVSLYIAAVIVTALHEFAHGFACKHFGGEVPSMGMLLILAIFPCFYTDVSDTWLFNNKSHRLWVTAAGVIFEGLIWGVSVLVWSVTATESLVHQLALAVIVSSGIGIIFTLNPLLKFDGYFLLSDALDIPNLRNKAMAYFSIWVGTLLDGGKSRLPIVSRRDARVFKLYGFAALAITFLILGSVLFRLAGAAMEYWGGVFLLPVLYLGWILLGSTLKGIWAGMVHEPGKAFDSNTENEGIMNTMHTPSAAQTSTETETPDQSASAPQSDNHSTPPEPRPSKVKRPLLVVLLIAAFVTGSGFITGTLEVEGPVTFRPGNTQSVEPRVQGFIAEVFVQEGSRVRAGDPLLRIEDEPLQLALDSVETEIASIQAQLQLLVNGPKQEEIDARLATIDMIKGDIEYYKSVYEQLEEAPGVITRLQLQEKKFQWEQVEHRLLVAERELDALLSPPRAEEIKALEARLDNLTTRRVKHLSDLDNAVVRAPIDGVVITKNPEQLVGRFTSGGVAVIEIEDNRAYKANISVRERDASLIALGQRVELKAFGYPDRVFEGQVTHIASTLGVSQINSLPTSTIIVEADVNDPDNLIKTGMGGNAKLYTAEMTYRDILFRSFTGWFKLVFW